MSKHAANQACHKASTMSSFVRSAYIQQTAKGNIPAPARAATAGLKTKSKNCVRWCLPLGIQKELAGWTGLTRAHGWGKDEGIREGVTCEWTGGLSLAEGEDGRWQTARSQPPLITIVTSEFTYLGIHACSSLALQAGRIRRGRQVD
jgi:hypothetical protein